MKTKKRKAEPELLDGYRRAYRKACACNSTASTGVIRFGKTEYSPDRSTATIAVEFIPGPSCDDCGRAWKVMDFASYRVLPGRSK